jgi:hypothetical protein
MERRVIVAFLLAPATIPFGVIAWTLMTGVHLRESTVVGSIYAAFTYSAALLIGVPVYLAFSRRAWTAWWQYAAAGAVTGICVWLAILVGAQQWLFDVRTVMVFIGAGVISSMTFWVIGIYDPQ